MVRKLVEEGAGALLTAAVMLKVSTRAGFEKLNWSRPGSMDESVGMRNRESCSGNFWSPIETPERPVVTGKLRVKGYGNVGPYTAVPVSVASLPTAFVLIFDTTPFRSMRDILDQTVSL